MHLRALTVSASLLAGFTIAAPAVADSPSREASQIGNGNLFRCADAKPTEVCVESITVNGVAPNVANVGSATTGTMYEVQGYVAPEGTKYSPLLRSSVMETSSLFNVFLMGPGGDAVGIDPSWKIGLTLNMRQADITYSMFRGPLDSFGLSRNASGELLVTMSGSAAKQSWFAQPEGMTSDRWLAACVAEGSTATVDIPPKFVLTMVKLEISKDPGHDLSQLQFSRGVAVGTNYGCGTMPIPYWDPNLLQLSVVLKAPHFTASGEVNMGFFKAFLPPSYLLDAFGLSIEEALSRGMTLTSSYGTSMAMAMPAMVSPTPDGGVMLESIEGFHYSSPKITVKRTSSKQRGSRVVKMATTTKKITRNSPANITVTVPGVTSGKVFVYVADRKGLYTFLQQADIVRGKARVTATVPSTVVTGTGKLVISYGGSKTFARSLVKARISIA